LKPAINYITAGETKRKFVKWLKETGTPVPKIAQLTELTETEIKNI
jgi:hypothetical protein